jgi:predicted TIM-barrel fold metal-dependent hydrolase
MADNQEITGSTQGTANAAVEAGKSIAVLFPEPRPIIDAHMHIMSLNCTPMPLQWATTYLKVPSWLPKVPFVNLLVKSFGDTRAEMTELSAARNLPGKIASLFTGDLGRIGQYSTNLIADVFMGMANNAGFEARLHWLLKKDSKAANDLAASDSTENREAAGEKLGLEGISTKQKEAMESFEKAAAYYYSNTLDFRMNIAMPMDLSYAHYWGLHDMPIYLPVLGGNTFFMIHDFFCIEEGLFKLNYEPLDYSYIKKRYRELPQQASMILNYSTSLKDPIDEYFDKLREGIESQNVNLPILRFGSLEGDNQMFNPKGLTVIPINSKTKSELQEKVIEEKNIYINANNKDYKHYLMEIKGDSTEMFEDYWEQAALHEASLLKYPLQIIPFFHYDPRRYYPDVSVQNTITNALANKHSFFDADETEGVELSGLLSRMNLREINFGTPIKKTYVRLHDFKPLGTTRNFSVKEYFDTVFFRGFYTTSLTEQIGMQTMPPIKKKHSDCVAEYLYPNGPFIGVKVYPPLGYPADLASTEQADRFDYPVGRFDNYLELFRHCIQYNLPVTAHASPLGMSIADGHNYLLRDQSLNKNGKFKKEDWSSHPEALDEDKTNRHDTALYVDEIATHPMHWRRLLKESEFNDLKLCLAHFSGMGAWMKDKNDVRKDWREDVIGMINEFPNVYTDISCYTIEYGIFKNKFKSLAKELVDKIKENENLQWRILMGSDWYMAETEGTGAGGYYTEMFELLTEVTRLIGGEWDAWHQFTVVNPLMFMGLIEVPNGQKEPEKVQDPQTGKYYYNLDTTRLEKSYENIQKKVQSGDWKTLAHFNPTVIMDDLKKQYDINLALLKDKNVKIYTADSMTKDGKLIILS